MAKKVLVVEDEPDSRIILSTILKHVGYDVAEAADGIEAVDTAKAYNPDLILLDVSMPRMSGWDACVLLRADEQTAETPVVILTAHAMDLDRGHAIKVGANAFVTKPVEPRKVVETVHHLIGAP